MGRLAKLRLLALAGGVALALVIAAPAGAITGGQPDGNGHPNVGLMVVDLPPFGTSAWCSGTLIAPTYFLTAGHCLAFLQLFGGTVIGVTFDPAFDPASSPVVAASATTLDPGFGHDQGDFHDLAMITLARAVATPPALLPSAGLLDQLAAKGGLRGQAFTAVGYGATGILFGGGPPQPAFDPVRRVATPAFMALDQTRLFLLINIQATGSGGPCIGDSGGPEFLDVAGTPILVSLTSSKGDLACRGFDVNYRLDTPSARAFLGRFVTLP